MFIKPCMVLFFTGFSHEIPSCTLYSSSQSFFDFWNIPSTTLSPPTPFMRAAVSPGPGLKVTVTQLCLTLCYPMDCTVHWIVQARILEWVAVPFSRGSFQPDFQLGIEPRSPTLQADSYRWRVTRLSSSIGNWVCSRVCRLQARETHSGLSTK